MGKIIDLVFKGGLGTVPKFNYLVQALGNSDYYLFMDLYSALEKANVLSKKTFAAIAAIREPVLTKTGWRAKTTYLVDADGADYDKNALPYLHLGFLLKAGTCLNAKNTG